MILDVMQADPVGVSHHRRPHALPKKLDCLGKGLERYSLETVRMFPPPKASHQKHDTGACLRRAVTVA
jgi:hypothetical protein